VGSESAGKPAWRTAKRCDSGQCVEIGIFGGSILIRDSADRNGICLALDRGMWQMFVSSVKIGDFDGL
jgi:hypothetical protein